MCGLCCVDLFCHWCESKGSKLLCQGCPGAGAGPEKEPPPLSWSLCPLPWVNALPLDHSSLKVNALVWSIPDAIPHIKYYSATMSWVKAPSSSLRVNASTSSKSHQPAVPSCSHSHARQQQQAFQHKPFTALLYVVFDVPRKMRLYQTVAQFLGGDK